MESNQSPICDEIGNWSMDKFSFLMDNDECILFWFMIDTWFVGCNWVVVAAEVVRPCRPTPHQTPPAMVASAVVWIQSTSLGLWRPNEPIHCSKKETKEKKIKYRLNGYILRVWWLCRSTKTAQSDWSIVSRYRVVRVTPPYQNFVFFSPFRLIIHAHKHTPITGLTLKAGLPFGN